MSAEDEVLEAGARSLYEDSGKYSEPPPLPWERLRDELKETYRDDARRVLRAALETAGADRRKDVVEWDGDSQILARLLRAATQNSDSQGGR